MVDIKFLKRTHLTFKLTAWFILSIFSLTGALIPHPAYAQNIFTLPAPGTIIPLTPAFEPPLVKGMTLYPEDPFKMDFIISPGQENLKGDAFKIESEKLIKYFMAAMTVPDEEMWVNLSPYESDRIIADALAQTAMGRDMLAQDYMLKQLTASLINPEEKLGEEFWRQVHEQTGVTDLNPDSFNKIWIIPEDAKVTIIRDNVFVVDNHLKVMLEEDYLATNENGREKMEDGKTKQFSTIHPHPSSILDHPSSNTINNIFRQVILPKIEREINEGTTFANLRQMFNSMILATWYKQNLKESILTAQYANQNQINGIEIEDKDVKEKIYNQYVESFKKGVFDFIKEDYDPTTQTVVTRKYFSGGVNAENLSPSAIAANSPIDGEESRVAFKLNETSNPIVTKDYVSGVGQELHTIEQNDGDQFNLVFEEEFFIKEHIVEGPNGSTWIHMHVFGYTNGLLVEIKNIDENNIAIGQILVAQGASRLPSDFYPFVSLDTVVNSGEISSNFRKIIRTKIQSTLGQLTKKLTEAIKENANKFNSHLIEAVSPEWAQGLFNMVNPANTKLVLNSEGLWVDDVSNIIYRTLKSEETFPFVIKNIVQQLNDELKAQGKDEVQTNPFGKGDDLVGAVMRLGGSFTYDGGKMYMTEDGILVIIDDRFEGDHAGRGSYQLAAYARTKEKAQHELKELRTLIAYARETGILQPKDLNSDYSKKVKAYTNDPSASDEELLRRRNQVILMLNTAHIEGVKAEGTDREVTQDELVPLLTLEQSIALGQDGFDFTISSEGGETDQQKRNARIREIRIADARKLVKELMAKGYSLEQIKSDITFYQQVDALIPSETPASRDLYVGKYSVPRYIFDFLEEYKDGNYLTYKQARTNILAATLMVIKQKEAALKPQRVNLSGNNAINAPPTIRSRITIRNAIAVLVAHVLIFGLGYFVGSNTTDQTPAPKPVAEVTRQVSQPETLQYEPAAPLVVTNSTNGSTASTTSTTLPTQAEPFTTESSSKLWPEIRDIPGLNEEMFRFVIEGSFNVDFSNLQYYFSSARNFAQMMEAKYSVESGGNTNAESSANANGLVQMTPIAWAQVIKVYPQLALWANYEKYANEPIINLYFSMAYFNYLLELMEGDDYYPMPDGHFDPSVITNRIEGALAAYNAGPSRSRESLDRIRNGGISETTNHVKKIMRQFRSYDFSDNYLLVKIPLRGERQEVLVNIYEASDHISLSARLPSNSPLDLIFRAFSKTLGLKYTKQLIEDIRSQNPEINFEGSIPTNEPIYFSTSKNFITSDTLTSIQQNRRSRFVVNAENASEITAPATQKQIGSKVTEEDLKRIITKTETRTLDLDERKQLSQDLQEDHSRSLAYYSGIKSAFPEFEKDLRTVKSILNGEESIAQILRRLGHAPDSIPITEIEIREATEPMIRKNGKPIDALSYMDGEKLIVVIAKGNEVGAFHEIYEQIILPLDPTVPEEARHTLATLAETAFSKSIISERALRELEGMDLDELKEFIDDYERVKKEIFSYNRGVNTTSKFGNYGPQSMLRIGYALKHALALNAKAKTIYKDKKRKGASTKTGGIDFNPSNLNLTVEGEALKARFKLDPAQLQAAPLDGLVPVIINITPLTNIPVLLGLENKEEKSVGIPQNRPTAKAYWKKELEA